MITNSQSGTNIHEIAAGIYRINTPVTVPGSADGFSFNQYLVVDDEPLLFHTGPRRMFKLTRAAIDAVMPAQRLRYIGLSHFEGDECGALNEFLAIAPQAQPLCGRIAAMTSIADCADRGPRVLRDGEDLTLGSRIVRWFDTPHMPHSWECGLLMEMTTRTFFCGDLFTQGGRGDVVLTESDILGPSEAFRRPFDYYSHAPHTASVLDRLAREQPQTLACMHGSAWRGDGAGLLRALAGSLQKTLQKA